MDISLLRDRVGQEKPHVLVLALPQQGHIQPLMHLSKKLASVGFIITFVVSEQDYTRMSKAQSGKEGAKKADVEDKPVLDIRLQSVPDMIPKEYPDDDHYDRLFQQYIDAMLNMRTGTEKLIEEKLKEEESQPFCFIITDAFVRWANEVASAYNIPLLVFFTANAFSCTAFYFAHSLESKGILPFRDEKGNWRRKEAVDLPGGQSLLPEDFPFCLTFWPSHFRYQLILTQHGNFEKSQGIILNTFEELEPKIIEALRCEKPVYAVGPLLLLCGESVNRTKIVVSYWREQEECLEWLDKHSPASVLYVAFGSSSVLPAEQVRELAYGLESTNLPFLWVIRPDGVEGNNASSSLDGVLPEGFMERIKDRGAIISWAPQLLVLSHPSVGGFVTHCGWNSTTENLSYGGVPLICWPHAAEQRMNCRAFVDDWKIALEFAHRASDGMVERSEVERVVKELMVGEKGKELHARALHLKTLAKKAVEEGGSSLANFQRLVQTLASSPLQT